MKSPYKVLEIGQENESIQVQVTQVDSPNQVIFVFNNNYFEVIFILYPIVSCWLKSMVMRYKTSSVRVCVHLSRFYVITLRRMRPREQLLLQNYKT